MRSTVVEGPSAPTRSKAATRRRPARDREAVWWSAGWLAVVVLGAAFVAAAGLSPTERALTALAVGAAPATVGLFLKRAHGSGARAGLVAAWGVCAALAATMTGGVTGPLAAWLLAPMAAALAVGRGKALALGAATSLAAVGATALAGFRLDIPPPVPDLAQGLALIGLTAAALGFGVGLVALSRQADQEAVRRDRQEMRLRQALEEQPHQLLGVHPEGRLTAVWGPSPSGLVAGAAPGGLLLDLAAPQDRPRLASALKRALAEGAAEIAFTPDGIEDGWLALTLRRTWDGRAVGALRDGRPERERMAGLEAAKTEAEAQNAGKSRFLANMSHELRTPLNAIMGFSDIMKQRLFGPLSDRYGEYAELIHDSGTHLLELINDVLDMSKIEAERFELSREEFDARDAVSGVLRLMRGQADRAGVHLRGLLPKDALDVVADRRALKQIVLNLISNALKFTPSAGSVTVTVRAEDGVLEVIVADTGVGIGREDLARLGRPYEQAGDAGQRAAGTGLGLSLVRAFAELHGGAMTIESRLGEGTTVIVRMPVLLEAAAPARTPEPVG
ncbi:HAMP domain-containing sensor histidine kinase [Phenylobacterium sp.]|uniref:sensor histidine kinase n=1 Tax=Phenylobacterium sp. TaxID=1871053 RepID=UPI002733CE71|nr:HAMP domain-containing sensor histidine kinase [Phenylobacterium sp.]MDP3855418.1 HAMP domain-containing sensor histidine kinase [Phenylobacterium sp.]